MNNLIWDNGHLINDTERALTIQSRIRYGDGVFDTLLVHDGKPARAQSHFERLIRHAQVLSIHVDMTFDEFTGHVQELIQKNDIDAQSRYILNSWVIRGPSQRGLMPSPDAKAHIILKLSKASAEPAELHGAIVTNVKRNEGSPLSRVKSCNYGDNILAIMEAARHDCNEAILMNNQGHVTCTSIGNIFCVSGETMITPPISDGAIDGTVRALLIERYGAVEKSITQDMLEKSDSIFMTNSVRGIQFFKSVNGRALKEKSLGIDKDFHVIS